MINKSLRSKLLTAAVVTSMMLSISIGAFADNNSNIADSTSVTQNVRHKDNLCVNIDSLVKSGDLSEESAAAIKSAIQPQGMRQGKGPNGINKNGNENKPAAGLTSKIEDKLADLADAGTITEDEKSAILNGLSDNTNCRTVFENLVSDGTLTSDRASEIQTALRPEKGMNRNNGSRPQKSECTAQNKKDRASIIESKLADLVDAGTITENEKDAVLDLFSNTSAE